MISLRGVLLAFLIVILIIGGLWLYSGVWPPLVVIESSSMQHSNTRSFIGVIDTGDLVVLKQETAFSNIRTYLESVPDGYSTYGELGDVVIYRPYGSYSRTPIIHRALCEVVYNASGGGFDVPSLTSVPSDMWEIRGGEKTWYNIHGALVLNGIGHNQVEVRLNFTIMLSNFANSHITPHGGLITLGDNNQGIVDQSSLGSVCWQPIQEDWLNGLARGEIPWFGLIKLYLNGQASQVPIPQNSVTNLLISLGLIIGIPITIDATVIILESRGIDAGAWLRKKLRLPPKRVKASKEQEPPVSSATKERTTTKSSDQKGKPKSGNQGGKSTSRKKSQQKGKGKR